MGDDRPTESPGESVLDTIGDAEARMVLAALNNGATSARDLIESLDMSRATVYRRLDLLEEHGLIEAVMAVDKHGDHHRVYRCTFEAAVVFLREAEYDVQVVSEEDLPSRFADLWAELGGTSSP